MVKENVVKENVFNTENKNDKINDNKINKNEKIDFDSNISPRKNMNQKNEWRVAEGAWSKTRPIIHYQLSIINCRRYQLALRTPGISPSEAISRRQMRQTPNLR